MQHDDMITLGPLVFALTPILLVAAIIGAQLAARREAVVSRRLITSALYRIAIAGIVVGRLGYVIVHWAAYRHSLIGVLDMRDGGFLVVAGVLAGSLMALWTLWKEPIPSASFVRCIAIGVAIFGIGTQAISSNDPVSRNVTLPDPAFSTLRGEMVRLDQFRGKPVVVNLWATWCPPCRREMPLLQQAQQKNPGIVFIFADQGETPAAIQQYLSAEDITVDHVLLDSEMVLGKFAGSSALPTTLFFDVGGKLVKRRLGALSDATLAEQLAHIAPLH